ncbi:MAG: hypothetical protein L0Y64_21530 [Myxococcaceae bacterium]|nr:hypothetical protein [Myxococcaceae bacterium]
MTRKPLMHLPPPGRPSRRSVLRRGLFGGALLALGGAGLLAARPGALVPLPPEGLRVLSPQEYAVLVAFARHALPNRPGFPTVEEVHLAVQVDRLLTRTVPGVAEEVKQLLGLFDNALTGFLFAGQPRAFTTLSHVEQAVVLEGWRTSRLVLRRTGFTALRTLVYGAYYGNPATWAAVGYPGPLEGIHQPDAPVYRGGKRANDNGAFVEPSNAGGGTP